MSWQLASFTLLAAALAVGFAWYERSRPPSRVVALVATLAALAALGRIAFAPLPNVKPTTDIVLIAGFALGGRAGFTVGAVAALASNFFFGQGPWTPWQMLAWGGTGVAGALLARATGRRLSRAALALACGIAGFAFGAVLNFSTWVTFTGRHTLGEFTAIAGSAFPFDVAHAVGNVVFALAFGPALVRALMRYRARFEITWRPLPAGAATLLVTVGFALAVAGPAAGALTQLAYVRSAQNLDGGFGAGRGQRSTQLHTGWAALGLAGAGVNPLDVSRGGRTPLDFIRAGQRSEADVGGLERNILVLGAAGVSSRDFAGRDLVAALLRHRRRNGSIAGQDSLTAFGILALRSAGLPATDARVRAAARWLEREQNRDGGFSPSRRGGASGIDDTASPVQALAAAGRRSSAAVSRAIAFLRRGQNRDGGFPLQPDGDSNAQSTAWAIQSLVAAHRAVPLSATRYLRRLIAPDGHVRYSHTSNQTPVWVTAQALLALHRKAFPLAAVRRRVVGTGVVVRPAPPAKLGGGREPAEPATAAAGDDPQPTVQQATGPAMFRAQLRIAGRSIGALAALLLAAVAE